MAKPADLRRKHRAFARLILGAAAAALLTGTQASPPRDVPTYALDSVVIYKCEVALALFLASYLFVVAILLAMQGRTIGKVSTTGFDLPADMASPVRAHQALITRHHGAQSHLAAQNERLSGEVESLWREVGKLGGRGDGKQG